MSDQVTTAEPTPSLEPAAPAAETIEPQVIEAEPAPELEPEQIEPTTEAEDGEGTVQPLESVEIEFDGQKYNVPPELKDSIMRQADYSRKTKELAEQRRDTQTQAQQLEAAQQTQQENLQDYGTVQVVDQRLNQLRELWQAPEHQNPENQAAINSEFIQLTDAKTQAEGRITQRQQDALNLQHSTYAKQVQEADAVLTRDIPGWGPELGRQVGEFAKANGVTDQQMATVAANAGFVKLLHLAFTGSQLLGKQRAAAAPPPKAAEPVKTVKPRANPTSGPNDKQSIDKWMAERNKQVAG